MRNKAEKNTLSTVSEQMLCDAKHPENVHKLYALNKNEGVIIDLQVPDTGLKDGDYDIYVLTARKCYKDLTASEAANNYNRVGPAPDGKKIDTVTIGPVKASTILSFIPYLLLLIGIVLAIFAPTRIIGIGLFAVGALWSLWSLFGAFI